MAFLSASLACSVVLLVESCWHEREMGEHEFAEGFACNIANCSCLIRLGVSRPGGGPRLGVPRPDLGPQTQGPLISSFYSHEFKTSKDFLFKGSRQFLVLFLHEQAFLFNLKTSTVNMLVSFHDSCQWNVLILMVKIGKKRAVESRVAPFIEY